MNYMLEGQFRTRHTHLLFKVLGSWNPAFETVVTFLSSIKTQHSSSFYINSDNSVNIEMIRSVQERFDIFAFMQYSFKRLQKLNYSFAEFHV